MQYSKYSNRSSSVSTTSSSRQSHTNRLKSPVPSDYEYLGRLVTRERPIIRKSKSIQQNLVFPQNTHKYHHSMGSHRREIYEEVPAASSGDDSDELSTPLGIIRINDRHLREIYRLPTPPPKVKRVYHRLQSPEPKVIERIFVRRPPPQIIENIIQVPPEKVRIINRAKYLEKSAPITRSKLVHLNSRHHREEEEEQQQTSIPSKQYSQQQQTFIPAEQYSQQQQQTFIPAEQYSQQQQQTFIPAEQYSQQQQQTTTTPLTTSQQPATTLVYPPQSNMRTVGYIQSTIPPHIMFNSQKPLQVSAEQMSNQQMVQPTPYNHPPQPTASHQMIQSTPFTFQQQQTVSPQMIQPTPFNFQQQQTVSPQMIQPTPYNYLPHQTIPNSPYGYMQ